ncbi:MAG: hypothetical protein AAF532_06085 [Planctomycetota bacterium]
MRTLSAALAACLLSCLPVESADAASRPSFFRPGVYVGPVRGFGPATYYGPTPTYGPFTHVYENPPIIGMYGTSLGRPITFPGSPVMRPAADVTSYGAAGLVLPAPPGGYGFPYAFPLGQ